MEQSRIRLIAFTCIVAAVPSGAQTTTRCSVSSSGAQSNAYSFEASLSGDGGRVAFQSLASNLVPGDTNGASDVFVRDRQTGVTLRVSVDTFGAQANGPSELASISSD